jgi:crossover junction endodeoxyribonuclease RuvC
MQSPLILGIDPGYDRVGWAAAQYNQQKKVVFAGYGCIQTDKNASSAERYLQITTELNSILKQHQPEEVALESIFFTKNQTTAMQVAEARGLIIGCCLTVTPRLFNYTPSQIKLAVTGSGTATKPAVTKMVALQTGLQLNSLVDDTVDAMAVAITHLASRQMSSLY